VSSRLSFCSGLVQRSHRLVRQQCVLVGRHSFRSFRNYVSIVTAVSITMLFIVTAVSITMLLIVMAVSITMFFIVTGVVVSVTTFSIVTESVFQHLTCRKHILCVAFTSGCQSCNKWLQRSWYDKLRPRTAIKSLKLIEGTLPSLDIRFPSSSEHSAFSIECEHVVLNS